MTCREVLEHPETLFFGEYHFMCYLNYYVAINKSHRY